MPKQKKIIFYAWQNDILPILNRNFIEFALKSAIKALNADPENPFDFHLDKDTFNLPGSPNISDAILKKIDAAAIFVGDVTIIGRVGKSRKPVSNPNVMLELGYALKRLMEERLVMVANTHFGPVDKLPFDTKAKRILPYNLSGTVTPAEKRTKRNTLTADLRNAVWLIAKIPQPSQKILTTTQRRLSGISLVGQQASSAFGPTGRHFVGRSNTPTRDGVKISQNLMSDDPSINQGILMMSSIADDMRRYCGDGAKLATIICTSLTDKFYRLHNAGHSTHEIVALGEDYKNKVIELIKESAEPFTEDHIYGVAKASGGKRAAEILSTVFEKDPAHRGAIIIESFHREGDTTTSTETGFRCDNGFYTDDFANDPNTGECTLHDCLVLLVDEELTSNYPLRGILGQIAQVKKPVLILARDFTPDVISFLTQNNSRGILDSVAVQIKGIDQDKTDRLKDLAVFTRAAVFGTMHGLTLESASLNDLGQAKSVIVGAQSTLIEGLLGNDPKITIRVQQLRERINSSESAHERSRLQDRLANLTGIRTIISMRASVEADLHEKTYLMASAMRSIDSARMSGVVLGGGIAFHSISKTLRERSGNNLSKLETGVLRSFEKALSEPINVLLKKGRVSFKKFEAENTVKQSVGLNVRKAVFEDFRENQMFDSAHILVTAVEIAFHNARTLFQLG